jgi:excisionase family DNA binding protein
MVMQTDESGPFLAELPHSLSMDMACRILGISRRTVYYWIKDGRLQTMRTRMGSQRVLTESVKTLWVLRA